MKEIQAVVQSSDNTCSITWPTTLRYFTLIFVLSILIKYKSEWAVESGIYVKTHRTTGCFDDRLLTMMTDTGFYVPWRVGHNFRLAKLLEKPSGTLWWMSTLVSDKRSYRNKLTLYLSQIKPQSIIISEVSQEKSQKTVILSGCASLRQSLLSALIYNKTTIIQLHFCQIWSRSLIL